MVSLIDEAILFIESLTLVSAFALTPVSSKVAVTASARLLAVWPALTSITVDPTWP